MEQILLSDRPDAQLCLLAAQGDSQAETELVRRYNWLVRACARPLFLAGGDSPEDVVIGREELRERLKALKGRLSKFEAQILPPYLSGLSCGEIAQRVGRSKKSVDNAIQRIRRKTAL